VLIKFLKQVANGNPSPLLIHTSEAYLLKGFKGKIQKIILDNKNIDFNFDYFDDESFDTENIINSFYKSPFLSKRRVVVVNKIEKIDYSKLIQLHPLLFKNKKTFLIFISNELLTKEKIKKKFFKAFDSKNILMLKTPNSSDIEKFILKFLKKENRLISDKAIFTLLENLDNNYMQAENELIKLINGTQPENEITSNDVLSISYAQNSYSVFDLLNLILENNISLSIEILKKYFENTPQGELIKFYALLHSQFQKILLYHYYKLKGYSFSEATRSSLLNYFDQKRIKSQKSNISFKRLLQKYEILLEYEPLIKFGGTISFYQMEIMITKIIEA
jgi:DNA polymerase III delta subunit